MIERHTLPDGTVIEIHGRVHDGMPDLAAAPAAVADPFAVAKHGNHDQSSHGNWARGGASVITADEARGNSRPVTRAEFDRIAAEGKRRYDAMKDAGSPPTWLDENFDAVTETAWQAVQNEWGGITVDTHTGRFVPDGVDQFALTVKDAGQDSVSIPLDADEQLFDAAMVEARRRFDAQLSRAQHHLGVFRDIDPVLVVDTLHEVETIGAYTHAIGGAYYFADGNGYWPPHVAGSVSPVTKGHGRRTPAQHFAESRDPDRPLFQPEEPVAKRGLIARIFDPFFAPARKAMPTDGVADPFEFTKHGSHDQSSHGNWARGHSADAPVLVSDIDAAARHLGAGKHVRLREYKDAAVLVDKLRALVADAEAKGEQAPNYDLCRVTVAGSNLFCSENKGVPRAKMPQLKGHPTPGTRAAELTPDERGEVSLNQLFAEHLEAKGVTITDTAVPAYQLKATQTELNGAKVAGIAKAYREGNLAKERLFVTTDGYVVDGHHRWASILGVDLADNVPGDHFMDVAMIDMDIIDVLAESNKFAADWGIPQAGFSAGFAKQVLLYNIVRKHQGPGNHPNGSPQSVHAGGGAGAVGERIAPHYQQPYENPSGRGGAPANFDATRMSSMTPEFRKQMEERFAEVGIEPIPDVLVENLDGLMERIKAEHPELLSIGAEWYNDAQERVAEHLAESGADVSLETAIGMTAAMSPNSEWGQNIAMTGELLRQLAADEPIIPGDKDMAWLKDKAKGKKGQAYKALYQKLKAGETPRLSELTDPKEAASAFQLVARGKGLVSENPTPKGTYGLVAFATGTVNMGKAIAMYRGASVDETLGGHKVRSFFNNISDPYDSRGVGDVTIDTHAASAAQLFRMPMTSKRADKTVWTGASTESNQQGAYPVYADAFREVARRHNMSANQAQAVLWIGWQAVRHDYPGIKVSEDATTLASGLTQLDVYGPARASTVGRYGIQTGDSGSDGAPRYQNQVSMWKKYESGQVDHAEYQRWLDTHPPRRTSKG
jgi:hypothetical protein